MIAKATRKYERGGVITLDTEWEEAGSEVGEAGGFDVPTETAKARLALTEEGKEAYTVNVCIEVQSPHDAAALHHFCGPRDSFSGGKPKAKCGCDQF